jgi:O-antigen/teichoic acid export membrane protein
MGFAAGHALATVVSIPALVGVPVRFRGTRAMMERLVQHGRHAASSRAGSSLHRSLDLWLVAALAGPAALALYVVAWKLADYAEVLLQPFVKVLVPELSAHGRYRPAAVRLAARAIIVLTAAIAVASLPLALWPGPCIELLAGAGYEAAAPALRTLVVFNLVRPLDRFTGVYLDAIGHPAVNARKVLVALSVNALATVLALIVGGDWALPLAAAASVLASLVGAVEAERSMRRLGVPGVLAALGRMGPQWTPHGRPHGP